MEAGAVNTNTANTILRQMRFIKKLTIKQLKVERLVRNVLSYDFETILQLLMFYFHRTHRNKYNESKRREKRLYIM